MRPGDWGSATIKQSSSLFVRGPTPAVKLLLLLLFALLLMTLDHRHNHLETVRAGLGVLLYPLQFAVNAPFSAGRWAVDNLSTQQSLLTENQYLRRQELETRARMAQFEALRAENTRLRQLLSASVKVADQVLVAEVMAVEMDPFSRKILLNKGSTQGVYKGQAVIDANGIMGQVVSVSLLDATALLITDPGHALPVQLNRNGLRALAVGRGASNTLELLHLPLNADIRSGDLVVTSGLAQRFPPGYPVGHVTAVSAPVGEAFLQVIVAPVASLERNREVLLVWPQGAQTAAAQATDEAASDAATPTAPDASAE